MPKSFFSPGNAASLSSVARGGSIHVIGVCGVAMAQLAIALSKEGYTVSGSDVEFYEPMGSLLKSHPISLSTGYSEENIPKGVKLVVIGNSISYGNPEVALVEREDIPYSFFPKLLSELLISRERSIVVSGTHGKSTTTALCATVLDDADKKPGYFIGGVVRNLEESLHVGQGDISVVEGDEYDSAFFAKVPKFSFYRPSTLIVTAIEFDHADIYPDLESIVREFDTLVKNVPANGHVICCIDDEKVRELSPAWQNTISSQLITYGFHESSHVQVTGRQLDEKGQTITCTEKGGATFSFYVPLLGQHNARNALSIYLACKLNGLTHSEVEKGLKAFQGVKRRQDLRIKHNGITLIEDFAHHPTAVLETLKAIREHYPSSRLIAVFEPRSNTSRRKVFQNAYIDAFTKADVVILSNVLARKTDEGHELIDVHELTQKIAETGRSSKSLPDADAIYSSLMCDLKSGDVIVVMSNGSFGGLIKKLEEGIRAYSIS